MDKVPEPIIDIDPEIIGKQYCHGAKQLNVPRFKSVLKVENEHCFKKLLFSSES